MSSKRRQHRIALSALSVALGLSLATGAVFAQSAVGSIYGDAKAGAEITIENLGSGASRRVTADKQGRYNLSQLPPGDYRVTSDGVSRSVHVSVGSGTEVDFAAKDGDATTLDAVTVTGTSVNPIDVSSVESSTIFTAQKLQQLPVEREISAVALLAPGVVAGDEAYGKLVSIGGASVAENGYYINGFDITNPRGMMSYFDIPYEAIGEAQIKTGGYGAEYGRSLGGVLGQVLKRGTNEWHYGAAVYWSPDFLREKQIVNKPFRERDLNDGRVQTSNKDDSADYLKYNVYASGPIIKDRLFFFALYQGKGDVFESYGSKSGNIYRDKTPQEVVKLDWNITDNHLLEFTGINAKANISADIYTRDVDGSGKPINPYTKQNLTLTDNNEYTGGGKMASLRYTGWFGDNFTLSAQAGRMESVTGGYRNEPSYAKCPYVIDTGVGGNGGGAEDGWYNEIGCAVADPNYSYWYRPVGTAEKDIRTAFRIDGGWTIGNHEIKFGWDSERIQSNGVQPRFQGEVWYDYFSPDANGEMIDYLYSYATFGGLSGYGSNMVLKLVDDEGEGTFRSKNTAIYLDDNWHVTDNLLLYAGLRKESFDNRNQLGREFIRGDAQWSPRLGFSWDVKGDSSFKLYGTLGRYYIPAPGLLAITNTRYNYYTVSMHTYTGRDPVTNAPTGLSAPLRFDTVLDGGSVWNEGAATGVTAWNFSTNPPQDPRTVVSQNLKPMGQDELILGAQWTVGSNWTLGLKGIRRNLINGVDNYCYNGTSPFGPLVKWMNENGYPDYTAADANQRGQARCIFVNPGEDAVIAVKMDATPDSPLVTATLPNETLGMGTGLQHYKRNYNALELSLEKSTATWYLHADYVLSHSYGNGEGYSDSTYRNAMGTTDTNTSAGKYSGGGAKVGQGPSFDYPIVDVGGYGNLPSDRTHSFKVYGNIQLGEQFQLGGSFLLQSGRPLNCLGGSPYTRDDVRNGYTPTSAAYNAANPADFETLKWYATGSDRTHYCHDKPYASTYTDADGYKYDYTAFAPTLHPTGSVGRTPWYWNFDFSAAYVPKWANKKLTFRMNVFNLFNRHGVLSTNQFHDVELLPSDAAAAGYSQALTRTKAVTVDGVTYAAGSVVQAGDKDAAKLEKYGGGKVLGPSANYGKLPSYQSPRYVQFSVRYEF